ncbi:uncharacterized protein LOC133197254 isoform X2 [Saccostrea echinata]|uniref:uncharacterized protein LOC133197254 isoform X2 n=1 Tax=Saccostrea echinata TaxID=191078 RepID=UPI002A7EF342|nr:uncharacterized protein LOC133197254 isoform X2 [Saccostrea echinata]
MAAVSTADQLKKYRDTANVYSKFGLDGKAVAMESSGSSEEEEEADPPPLPRRNMRVKFQEEPLPEKEKSKPKQRKEPNGDFREYLLSNGLNEATVQKLLNEEIEDFQTLKILSEEDIEKLDLKTGQKARVRSLTRSQESTTEHRLSDRRKPVKVKGQSSDHEEKEPQFVKCSQDKRFPVEKSSTHSKTKTNVQVTKNTTGLVYVSSSSSESDEDKGEVHMKRDTLRGDSVRVANKGERDVELTYKVLQTEEKGKVVMELSTRQDTEIHCVKARILILVDISGSMGIKYDKRRKHSKLSRMKKFAIELVDSLDDGDFASVVTFGEKTQVLVPLQEINRKTRSELKTVLETLDKTYLSTKTNLSAGLSRAIDIFSEKAKGPEDLLMYRNSIIVFSDGEINEGTKEPNKLVHEVREKIRKNAFDLDDSQNQWVSISTIATGNDISEAMYLLSKCCSSDAFYHLDVQKSEMDDPDLFLPVMLRKTAVVWNVSVVIEAVNGATIINSETSQDNKVRLRGSSRGQDKSEKAFFYYDIPAASTRHIGVALDLSNVSDDANTVVLKAKVEYTKASGLRMKYFVEIARGEFTDQTEGRSDAIKANLMHDARLISQNVLHKAAEHVKTGNIEASTAQIKQGQSELQAMMERYGAMAAEDPTSERSRGRPGIVSTADTLMRSMRDMLEDVTEEMKPAEETNYAESIMNTMQNLLTELEESKTHDIHEPDGKSWAKIKAVSSAITREAPTMSNDVDTDLLAPLPNIRHISGNLQQQMENLQKKREARKSALPGTLQ